MYARFGLRKARSLRSIMRETPRCSYLTHACKILGYEVRIFVQDFTVCGLVHAAIFGTEQSNLEAVFFYIFGRNVEMHLINP